MLNAIVLNGIPERYQHFVVQKSFNPAGSFVELRTKLMNYKESRSYRGYLDDVDSHVAITSEKTTPKQKPSSNYEAAPKSSSGQLGCQCCGLKGFIKAECYERERVECTFRQKKGHLAQAWVKML